MTSPPLSYQTLREKQAPAEWLLIGCTAGAMVDAIDGEAPMSTSPMLKAIDLTRVNVDAMTLEELEEHAIQVLDTIAAVNEYLNSPAPKSANERQNALRLANKLRAHMAHVRDLINAHTAAAALVGAAQATGAANLAQGAKPFGL